MEYAISILEGHLRHEQQAQKDAIRELNKKQSVIDRNAFCESLRLSIERIPQLEKSIKMIRFGKLKR